MVWSSLWPVLSLDNVVVALALVSLSEDARVWRRLTAWFVGVEAAAPVFGSLLGHILSNLDPAETLRSALLVTMGAGVLGMTLAGRDAASLLRPSWAVAAISLFLGVDNLVAGAALPVRIAVACGFASAVPVLIACVLARLIGVRLPLVGRAAACGALLIAVGMTGLG